MPKVKGKMNLFLGGNYQVNTEQGVFDCADKRSITMLYPFYEPEFREFLHDYARQGKLFVDIGANIGALSVAAGRKFMEVLAFEPTIRVFSCLSSNLSRMVPHSQAVPFAAWSSKGIMDLRTTIDSESNTLYEKDVSGHLAKSLYPVITVPLDNYLFKQDRQPHIIKIDAEGAEAEVLKGAELSIDHYRPKIFFESFADGKIEECLSILTRHDYKVVKVSSYNYVALPT